MTELCGCRSLSPRLYAMLGGDWSPFRHDVNVWAYPNSVALDGEAVYGARHVRACWHSR